MKTYRTYQLAFLYLTLTLLLASEDCDYNAFLIGCNRASQINQNSDFYKYRLDLFQRNCLMNKQHNLDSNSTYSQKNYCNMADCTQEEVRQKLGIKPLIFNKEDQAFFSSYHLQTDPGKVSATVLPTSYSYVTLNQVTSVKDQGSCGSCWSFAVTAMYQSLLLKRGYNYGLSEQASLQCTSFYAPGQRVSDCQGGYFRDSLTFLGKVGSVLRTKYPYIASAYGSKKGYPNTPGICSQTNRISIGNGTAAIYTALTATQLKTLLIDEGPLMIGVYANLAFSYYSGGVFTGCPSYASSYINHAILLVGYDDSTSSWLAKNQWGSDWGESGYIRISYTNDCGLSSLVGNIQFSNYNADPNIILPNSSLIYTEVASTTANHECIQIIPLLLISLLFVFLP